ncbi:MAG: peptide-methionine (R)-S-oxide reductase MsrB [Gammaproteobacteria bacterium]
MNLSKSRRNFLIGVFGFTGFVYLQILSGKSKQLYTAASDIQTLTLSDDEWKQKLSENAYYVLRKGKTEIRQSSPLNKEWRTGVYLCQGCDLDLFTSEMKYESHTGWPSFKQHILGHLVTYTDLSAIPPQRAYKCARCGGHHGHLFMDGPLPKGERWCNNGNALHFKAS